MHTERTNAFCWPAVLICCTVTLAAGCAVTLAAGCADAAPVAARIAVAQDAGGGGLASPRDLLARFDIGPSELEQFADGRPLGPGEQTLLTDILYRLPRLGLDQIERWRRNDVGWDGLASSPRDYRADFFRLAGRAIHVAQHDLPAERAAVLEFSGYYAVTLDLDRSPYQAVVYTRTIPQSWKPGQPLDERATAEGLFLKLGDQDAGGKRLIFAARRIAWLPDRPRQELGIGPDQVALAERGFDVGLLDDVRTTNHTGLVGADREAFYQLLAAIGQTELQPSRRCAAPLDVAPLLERPEKWHGQVATVEGIARRIVKVPVSDADVQQRFGINHYYEIDMFVSLGQKRLRLGDANADGPTYANRFPATLIVRRLPPGLPVGDNLRETVRAEAVFFKQWTYPSTYTKQFDQLQVAPLFMADEPEIVREPHAENWLWNVAAGAAIGLVLAAMAMVCWRYRRSDLAYSAERKRKLFGDEAPPPDFSSLR